MFQFQHEFRNYDEGVKKIRIEHGGKDLSFWSGHYGCKIAGSCIILELMDGQKNEDVTPSLDYLNLPDESH